MKKRFPSSLGHKLPNKNCDQSAHDTVEEEEEVDAKCVDDGGHHGGEENHRAAAHKLRHGRAHVPVRADWIELLKWLLVGF